MAAKLAEDWQGQRSLIDCNRYMLENDIADVSFKLTDKADRRSPVIVRALKTLLMARSSVFYAMFCGEFQEPSPEIEVTDVEPAVFKELLRYIYTDEVLLTADNVLAVLYASKKYMMSMLADKCSAYLHQSITLQTAPVILDQSLLYNMKDLITKSLECIQSEASFVLASTAFTELSPDAFRLVLNTEVMNASELEVFNASLRWAKHQCQKKGQQPTTNNIRTVLGDSFFLIRFPTMSLDEFNDGIVPANILSDAESVQIFRHLTAKTKPDKLPFITRKRAKGVLYNGKLHIEGFLVAHPPFQQVERHGNSEMTLNLNCEVSRRIQLKKILVHCLDSVGLHKVKLSLQQSGRVLNEQEIECAGITTEYNKPLHYSIGTNNIIVEKGKLNLDLCVNNTKGNSWMVCSMACTPPTVKQLSDGKVTLAMSIAGRQDNILLGIEYE